MATIETGDNSSNNNNKASSSKKTKRKHKSKSLIVSTSIPDTNDATTSAQSGTSLSAECDSIKFGLRPRFSFRKFGRGRSSSKQNLTDSNPNASKSSEANLKCPTITYNDADGKPSTSPTPPPLPSKPLATSSTQSKSCKLC